MYCVSWQCWILSSCFVCFNYVKVVPLLFSSLLVWSCWRVISGSPLRSWFMVLGLFCKIFLEIHMPRTLRWVGSMIELGPEPYLIRATEPFVLSLPPAANYWGKDCILIVIKTGGFSESKQEKLLFVLAPPCYSKGLNKAFPEFLIWPVINFYWWRQTTTLVGNILWHPVWGLSPAEERIWAPMGHLIQPPHRWQAATWTTWWRLPLYFSLTIFPLPLLKSLCFCVLSSLSVLSSFCHSESMVIRQLQNHSSQLVRAAPSGLERLTLMGDKQRRERLNLYPADLGPGPPHCRKLYERDTGSNLMLCSGWKLILPIFSPLFSCCQEKSSWEQAEDSYVPGTSGWESLLWLAVPHRMYNQTYNVWFPGLITLEGSGQGAPLFTALSGSLQVGAWIDTCRGWVGMAMFLCISFSFSVFSVPPPFTSPLVFTPILQYPLSWKLLVCL